MSWDNNNNGYLGYDYNNNHIYNNGYGQGHYPAYPPNPGSSYCHLQQPQQSLPPPNLSQNYFYNSERISIPDHARQPYQQYQQVANGGHSYMNLNVPMPSPYPIQPPHWYQDNPTPTNYMPPNTSSTYDAQEEFKEKLIAYARFNRNNELMKTILSDAVMPEISSIVTAARLTALTSQVNALKNHQIKMSQEIVDIEKEFKVKKRKFDETCEAFQENYKKLCEPPVSQDTYEEMVNKYYDSLKQNLELRRWQSTLAWAHETIAASGSSPIADTNLVDIL